ncbi:gamma-glutamyltransferase family protein [Dongia sp.]|uniref:gamma-glutamyltransferase family protein n=1 Tax=Dongia sp. TaxID=1977262 RepID=UPI0035AE04F4
MRDFHKPGRSPIYASDGAAATSHPLATAAAIACLREGGTAMDAAITASAVLAVVEPAMTGIGGDCFVLLSKGGGGDILAYNGNGAAPMKAEFGYFKERGLTEIAPDSIHAVTIPGAIDAWCRLAADHGRFGIDKLLRPAIHYAENGFPVAPRVAYDWAQEEEKLRADKPAAGSYLIGGKAPRIGDRVRLPLLGKTMREIAAKGAAGFYEGWVAEDMAASMQALGGLHTVEDFARHKGDYVKPIATEYRGVELWECPPPGQGLTALLMLNILSAYGAGKSGSDPLSADRFHLQLEAAKLAYRERNAHIADPAFARVSVSGLLSSSHAEALANLIAPDKALDLGSIGKFPKHPDTIYLTVVDKDRNAVSFINSVYYGFGSGRMAAKSGVLMQNRGACFVVDAAHPNCIGPGKRSMHTIIPAMVTKDGKAVMPYGVMGGDYQPVGQVHALTNMLDYGMDPQEALDTPRAFYDDGILSVESGIPAATVAALAAKGHRVQAAEDPLGGGQAIWIDWQKGILVAGSDPRKDGCALGY